MWQPRPQPSLPPGLPKAAPSAAGVSHQLPPRSVQQQLLPFSLCNQLPVPPVTPSPTARPSRSELSAREAPTAL